MPSTDAVLADVRASLGVDANVDCVEEAEAPTPGPVTEPGTKPLEDDVDTGIIDPTYHPIGDISASHCAL